MPNETMSDSAELLLEAVEWVKTKLPSGAKPEIALTLGSGLSHLAKKIQPQTVLPFKEIPGFVTPRVAGHKGELILGSLNNKNLLVFSGRAHFYEGYSMNQIMFPVRLAAGLGVRSVILTSAAGALNKKYQPGDLVVIRDHINFMGTNPLRGIHDRTFGERFPDLSECYSAELQKCALCAAKKLKLKVHSGVYFAVPGPSYETPAEVRAFRKLGGDVAGMSMVPEAVAARQTSCRVLGLSLVTNMASGITKQVLDHKKVLETGKTAGQKMSGLVEEIIRSL